MKSTRLAILAISLGCALPVHAQTYYQNDDGQTNSGQWSGQRHRHRDDGYGNVYPNGQYQQDPRISANPCLSIPMAFPNWQRDRNLWSIVHGSCPQYRNYQLIQSN